MRKRHIIFAIVIFGLLLSIVLFVKSKRPEQEQNVKKLEALPSAVLPLTATTLPPTEAINQQTNACSPPVGSSSVERWKWLNEMEKKDPYFEYKTPISFYGRVVDDAGNSISGVSIDLSWTDASEATGNSTRTVISDGNGMFLIEGIYGKALLVMDLTKEGYTKSLTQNRFSFNYGWFSDPYYHSPNPMNPVIFVMRKNRQGDALIVRSRQEARLESGGQSRSFPIGAGDVFVSVERLSDETPNARYWNARVTVPDGSLQLTAEEFPYEAPEDGYTNECVITNGMSVSGNQGGMFYVQTPKGYGRAMVYYVPNMSWVYVESWFNPNPNSRNLELDPTKIIKP